MKALNSLSTFLVKSIFVFGLELGTKKQFERVTV